MDIKKFISKNKKAALLIVVGVLVVTATAGALYLNSGSSFKGFLDIQTVGQIKPMNPASILGALPAITKVGVSNVYLSPTTLDLSAAKPSIVFNYGFKMNANKISKISIYVLPKGSHALTDAIKKWDSISPNDGSYNLVSWDGKAYLQAGEAFDAKLGSSYHFETYYFSDINNFFIPQIVSSPDFQVIKPAPLPLSAICKASSASVASGNTVNYTMTGVGGKAPYKFSYQDPIKGLTPVIGNSFSYKFINAGFKQIIKVMVSDSQMAVIPAFVSCDPVDVGFKNL